MNAERKIVPDGSGILAVALLPDGRPSLHIRAVRLDPELNDPGRFGSLISDMLDLVAQDYAQRQRRDVFEVRKEIVKMLTNDEEAKRLGLLQFNFGPNVSAPTAH